MPNIDVTAENIPDELRPLEQWICWREGTRNGKSTKIPTKPYRTNGSPNLDVTDPKQRRDFETAWESLNDSRVDADGLGFVFVDDGSVAGVDLDACRDPESGELEDWATEIIERLASYTEVSPSGTGVHILVRGELPRGGNRSGRVEMYDSDRYFTVTGEHLAGTPTEIRACQDAFVAVHRDYIQGGVDQDGQTTRDTPGDVETAAPGSGRRGGAPGSAAEGGSHTLHDRYGEAASTIEEAAIREALERVAPRYLPEDCPSTFADLAGPGVDLSDEELLERMFASRGGDRKRRLYEGDAAMWGAPESDYPSQSEADMALAHTLAFWTGKDPDRMDALFRNSGLYREKWDTPHYRSGATYGDVSIARSLLRVTDYYELPSSKSSSSASSSRERSNGSGDDRPDPPHPIDDAPGMGAVPEVAVRGDTPSSSNDTVDATESATRSDGDAPASPESREDGAGGLGATQTEAPPTATTTAARGPPEPVDEEGATSTGASSPTTPASPRGTDTDETLRDSTQRAMEASATSAGPDWERTDPNLDAAAKHPKDWTVGRIVGRVPTAQAMQVAREDNRILARRLRRQADRLDELQDLEDERDRYEFTAEVYLRAIDELMGERDRYRAQLRRAGLLSRADDALPDDPVTHLKRILRPLVRHEDARTAKETLTGLDAVLQEYDEANERIQAAERETRRGIRGMLSRWLE